MAVSIAGRSAAAVVGGAGGGASLTKIEKTAARASSFGVMDPPLSSGDPGSAAGPPPSTGGHTSALYLPVRFPAPAIPLESGREHHARSPHHERRHLGGDRRGRARQIRPGTRPLLGLLPVGLGHRLRHG